MKPNLYKIFSVIGIFLLGALVGGAVAGYGTSYFLGKFMMHGSTLSEMVAIKSNVFTLTKLRAGNSAEAMGYDGKIGHRSIG